MMFYCACSDNVAFFNVVVVNVDKIGNVKITNYIHK